MEDPDITADPVVRPDLNTKVSTGENEMKVQGENEKGGKKIFRKKPFLVKNYNNFVCESQGGMGQVGGMINIHNIYPCIYYMTKVNRPFSTDPLPRIKWRIRLQQWRRLR